VFEALTEIDVKTKAGILLLSVLPDYFLSVFEKLLIKVNDDPVLENGEAYASTSLTDWLGSSDIDH